MWLVFWKWKLPLGLSAYNSSLDIVCNSTTTLYILYFYCVMLYRIWSLFKYTRVCLFLDLLVYFLHGDNQSHVIQLNIKGRQHIQHMHRVATLNFVYLFFSFFLVLQWWKVTKPPPRVQINLKIVSFQTNLSTRQLAVSSHKVNQMFSVFVCLFYVIVHPFSPTWVFFIFYFKERDDSSVCDLLWSIQG